MCGLNDSCANYLSELSTLSPYTITHNFTYSVTVGYNRFDLDYPRQVSKGSLVLLDSSSGTQIAIDANGINYLYSDKIVNGSNLVSISRNKNQALYFNSLIITPYYTNRYDFQYHYNIFGFYNIQVKLGKSLFLIQRSVNITNGNRSSDF